MTSRDIQTVEGWLPDSSGVWPDGASKRGLPRPRQCKNLGWARRCGLLIKQIACGNFKSAAEITEIDVAGRVIELLPINRA